MAESPKVDDGKGAPAGSEGQKTPALKPINARMIPGGSFDAARTPIGVNAFDRDDLPSHGQAFPGVRSEI